jgi:hypothetical protein
LKTNNPNLLGYKLLYAECDVINTKDNSVVLNSKFDCTHGDTNIWNIGYLIGGETYMFKITYKSKDNAIREAIKEFGPVSVVAGVGEGSSPITDKLLFEFLATPAYYS